jgi:hypothetical protein
MALQMQVSLWSIALPRLWARTPQQCSHASAPGDDSLNQLRHLEPHHWLRVAQ